MKIEKLEVLNFRNLQPQTIEIGQNCTLFWGNNGQGKTNIIETIWLLSCGKSFRATQDREMIAFDKNEARISLSCKDEIRNINLEARLYKDKRKEVFIDGEKIVKNSQLLGNLITVLFEPDNLRLIKGSPENRRKFIDISLCQQSPSYLATLKEYNKILDGRNSLLKQIAKNEQPLSLLDIWDEALIQRAGKLIEKRKEYIRELSPACLKIAEEISVGKEEMSLIYQGSCRDIEELKYNLLRNREADICTGSTSYGCHRDDMDIILNGVSLKKYGSEGQKRTAVIALKLAEGEIIKEKMGISPVFLLDDVLSELDSYRREYILSKIKSFQVIITDCTRREGLKDVCKYKVENGLALANE